MIVLTRHEHETNCHRFYTIDVVADLFGHHTLTIAWGRVGTIGRYRIDQSGSLKDMVRAQRQRVASKLSRGYMKETRKNPPRALAEGSDQSLQPELCLERKILPS